ncbi:DUF2507 domain-containing protein [Salimicrobium flavidum]|uniref:DUF2507 domain-containing protein n=1 Tax=Salimicrobium flavidum TaxID=570947 RepID=A0A1N7JPC7_9BACI|nr:DUF2507 domain-containing protein [Salimicrobium flavidum]SIS51104.1 Protein of unknown function [Salimicrobium flavidum]
MKNGPTFTTENIASLVTTGSGFDILRYFTLPDLLGEDAENILYIMGRNIARQAEINSYEDIVYFFQYLGWGELTEWKASNKERKFTLSGHVIEKRLNQETLDINLKLESGFLAECLSNLENELFECSEEIDGKDNQAVLTAFHF